MKIQPIRLNDSPAYRVFADVGELGVIETNQNPFHSRNTYLKLRLSWFDCALARELFVELRNLTGTPLQVMLSSVETEQAAFLISGGFRLVRRCFETEVEKANLLPGDARRGFRRYGRGEPEYEACCELLYRQYAGTHADINPLTADLETFCGAMPDTVLCELECGQPIHFAFVEEEEIAYVGTTALPAFPGFIRSVLRELFARHDSLFFESDDTDQTAMTLRSMFKVQNADSYDTYVYQ